MSPPNLLEPFWRPWSSPVARTPRGHRPAVRPAAIALVLGLVLIAGACGEAGDCTDPDRMIGTSDQLGGPPDPEDALVDYLPGRMGGTDFEEQSRAAGEVTYEVYDGGALRGTVTLGDAGGGWHVDWARFCS